MIEGNKHMADLSTEAIQISSSYDEMEFINDWIKYSKIKNRNDQKGLYDEEVLEDESSFSSLMNFYISEDRSSSSESEESSKCILFNKQISQVQHNISCETIKPTNIKDEASLYDSSIISLPVSITSYTPENSLFVDATPMKSLMVVQESEKSLDTLKDEQGDIKTMIVEDDAKTSNIDRVQKAKVAQSCDNSFGLRVNKTVLMSTITIKKTNLQSIATAEHKIENDDGSSPHISTYSLFKEAEKRTGNCKKRVCEAPLQRFVIETTEAVVKLCDTDKLCDLRSKIILGRLYKRNQKGYYNYNWCALKENFLTCYNTKGVKSDEYSVDRVTDVVDPDNPALVLVKKYTVDIKKSRLLISKKKGRSDLFTCYSESIPAESDLVDITDIHILHVLETSFGYKVTFRNNNIESYIMLSCLNFCFRTDDGYRFFKVNTVDEFLKWIIAFKFRLGQIKLSIG